VSLRDELAGIIADSEGADTETWPNPGRMVALARHSLTLADALMPRIEAELAKARDAAWRHAYGVGDRAGRGAGRGAG